LLGFEARCEAEPALGLDDVDEEEEEGEDAGCVLPPAAEEPFRPFREEVWLGLSRTTDEKGAPAR
jgi:hypothetical protein